MTPSQLSVFLFLLLCQMHQTFAQMPSVQYTISTLVGYDPKPDQSISLAHIGQPSGLIVHQNYLYFAESISSSRVRRMNLSNMDSNTVVETMAGVIGMDGWNSDGPLAGTSMYLNNPQAMVLDATNSMLYVADSNNNRIRRIDLSLGTMETVAGNGVISFGGDGGPATSASLYSPMGLAFSPTLNVLYIADTYHYRIRKVTLVDNNIYTIAGDGTNNESGDNGLATSSQLISPSALAYNDTSNELYIATSFKVRKISGDIITTIAGTGTYGDTGDGGPATSAQITGINSLYLANNPIDGTPELFISCQSHVVRKINLITMIIEKVAGISGSQGSSSDGLDPNSAKLNNPKDMLYHFDSNSNELSLLVSDSFNYMIRRTNYTNPVSPIMSRFAGINPFHWGNGDIGTRALINQARHLHIKYPKMYIADSGNHVIRSIDLTSGIISSVAGTPGITGNKDSTGETSSFNYPSGIACDSVLGSDVLLISDEVNARIRTINLTSNTVSTLSATTSGLSNPRAVTVSPLYPERIYIASSSNHIVTSLNLTEGTSMDIVAGTGTNGFTGNGGLATVAKINYPISLQFTQNGSDLYVAEFLNSAIRKINMETNIISSVAGVGVANYAGDGGSALAANLWNPISISLSKSTQNLFIAEAGSSKRIRRVVFSSGIISTIAGGNGEDTAGEGIAATLKKFRLPLAVAVHDATGEIYVSDGDSQASRIWKLSPSCLAPYGLDDTKMSCTYACFGSSGSAACSGKGTCVGIDQCSCVPQNAGVNCELFQCYGIFKNESTVCSGKGICMAVNSCACIAGYSGNQCETFNCSSESNICQNGICDKTNCTCPTGFFGDRCESVMCNGILSNSANVCSGRGSCLSTDNCSCNVGYFGQACQYTTCYDPTPTDLALGKKLLAKNRLCKRINQINR